MLYLYVTLTSFVHTVTGSVTTATDRLRARRADLGESDRGSVTLEQVLITLGLFILAGVVVGVVGAAVRSRTGKIK